ncbi:hypothetical protein Sste5346_001148 [Sporothrix stenoceras]|uniref:DUF7918 domain-containing protein n=1 Tax=Sporothrix stenoceras TaxID=5173 RepID=A0ABR3ZQL3_9PEZI
MPTFRGIEMSIVAGSDNSVFPEFPHPDGSSVKLGGFSSSRHSSSIFHSPRRRTEADGHVSDDGQQHADPKISVYIPSAPDTNFYFRYFISQPPVGHRYLFFCIAINGRYALSFGVDLTETMVGAAHQALFQPSAHYQHNDNGVLMTQYGIESRCFRFVSNGTGDNSIGHDGGLIQVRVYRSKCRHRAAPQPAPFRGNDNNYGVALVSNGLLENPQTANFYDYHNVDPIDAPYATFRFHYRSWENLQLLHLAPPEKPEFLCASPAKTIDGESCLGFDFSEATKRHVSERAERLIRGDYFVTPSAVGFEAGGHLGQQKERPLPELPTSPRTHAAKLRRDAENDAALERAMRLKHVPADDTPETREKDRIERVRQLSAAFRGLSTTATSKVSISKSLEAYADGEGDFSVDTVELGSAVKIETVYQGKAKAKEKESLTIDREEFASPDDGVFLFEQDEAPGCKRSTAPPTERLALSPLKPTPKTIYVAPFTDSLRKREMAPLPESPIRQRGRRVSYDPSPRNHESSRHGRAHGGSLDSRHRTFLDEKMALEE